MTIQAKRLDITHRSSNAQLHKAYMSLNELLYARGMAPLPRDVKVEWSSRMGSNKLGMTYGYRHQGRIQPDRIVLNWVYFEKVPAIELEATLRHEAAHVWTAEHCGRLDHSKAWQHVARIFGDTGAQYAGCTPVAQAQALSAAKSVPTAHDELSKKQVHSMRTSFKLIARKYNLPLTAETFDRYIRPRFPHFSAKAINKARDTICKGI